MSDTLASTFGLSDAPPAQAVSGAVQRVYDDLRRKILTLALPPETVLSRNDLATAYGVSQTPVRDALMLLKQDGLVHIYPQSRTLVTLIDVPQLYEAHFLRVALETEVCRTLALTPNPDALKRARAILRMQEAVAYDTSQITLFQDLDDLFHQSLYAGVGRSGLHDMVLERSGHLARARRLHLPENGKIASILSGHNAVLDALEAGDADAAVAQIRDHLSRTVAKIESLRLAFPQYFA